MIREDGETRCRCGLKLLGCPGGVLRLSGKEKEGAVLLSRI